MRPTGFGQREAPGFHGCRPPYLLLGAPARAVEVTGKSVSTAEVAAHRWTSTAKLIDVYPPSA